MPCSHRSHTRHASSSFSRQSVLSFSHRTSTRTLIAGALHMSPPRVETDQSHFLPLPLLSADVYGYTEYTQHAIHHQRGRNTHTAA